MTPTARRRLCNVGVSGYNYNLTGLKYPTIDPVKHLLHGHILQLESNPSSDIILLFNTFPCANSELFAAYSDMPDTFICTERIITHYMLWVYM